LFYGVGVITSHWWRADQSEAGHTKEQRRRDGYDGIAQCSPAIDAGNDAIAPTTDQRGFGRVGKVTLAIRASASTSDTHAHSYTGGFRCERIDAPPWYE